MYEFFVGVYYLLFLLVALQVELSSLSDPSSIIDRRLQLKAHKDIPVEERISVMPPISGWEIVYLFLGLLGIISSQWLMFVMLILLGTVPKRYKYWVVIDAVLSLLVVFVIIINRYHIHYNWTDALTSLF